MGFYDDEMKRLKLEKEREENRQRNYECAVSLRDTYNSYIDVGFTEEQAYELLTILLKKINGGIK